MAAAPKVKISISIDPGLLASIDRDAARLGLTRSAAMERWLAQVSRVERVQRLQEETAVYYDSLTAVEREDDARWASAASRTARRLEIDDVSPAKRAVRRRG